MVLRFNGDFSGVRGGFGEFEGLQGSGEFFWGGFRVYGFSRTHPSKLDCESLLSDEFIV